MSLMTKEQQTFSRFGLVLLVLLTIFWGLNWPIMKVVLRDVPPLTFRTFCLLGGGIGILVLARFIGQSLRLPRQYWGKVALISITHITGWNVLAIYGLSLLPSGRAALVGYTMPLWSMLLSVWLLNDKMTPRKAGGLVLGMAGIFVLMSESLVAMSNAVVGVTLMVIAAFGWATGLVLLKRFAMPIPTLTLTGYTMAASGVPIAIAAVAFEHGAWRPIGLYPGLGVAYCVVIAFMFCYWAWNKIVLMVPVAMSTLTSLMTPVVGVISGMLLLGEPIGWREIAAAALILGAVALVLKTPVADGTS
jgi:drug/metabolite transporter (DMT)-like permease